MLNKVIATPWKNPYQSLQTRIRGAVNTLLLPGPARIEASQVLDAFNGDQEKANAFIRRCTLSTPEGNYIWKGHLVTIQDIRTYWAKPLPGKVELLFEHSMSIENRSNYPNLVPSKKMHLAKIDMFDPVFPFDILVRPLVGFSETDQKNNALKGGSDSILFLIHAELDEHFCLQDSTSIFFRHRFGRNADDLGVRAYIEGEYRLIRKEVMVALDQADADSLALTIINAAHAGIQRWRRSGI